MERSLQVEVIGASAERRWAKDSHLPAVQRLGGLGLGAVASGSHAGSDAAAKAFGARKAYASVAGLFRDPKIDIVPAEVRVPDHRELFLGSLADSKHIFCDWPLAKNLAESQELAQAAKVGALCIIGLQTRANPTLCRAKRLLSFGPRTTPDFDHAMRRTRLMEDVLSSSNLGKWQDVTDCPRQHQIKASVVRSAL